MKNNIRIAVIFLCIAMLMVAPSEKRNVDTKRVDSVSSDAFTPVGSRQNSFDDHGISDEERTFTDSTDVSTDSDLSSDVILFNSKSRLLKQINLYLKYELRLSDQTITTEMRSLRKLSISQLRQKYETNKDFMQREQLLRAYRSLLTRYKNYSSRDARAEILIMQQNKVDTIIRSYYEVVATLTKNQMLELIHDQIQFKLGFSGTDADKEIDNLKNKSLSEIRDTCMQYQRELIVKDSTRQSDQSLLERRQKMYINHEQSRSTRSIVRSIPVIKNIASLLPTKVMNWTDQDMYDQLALKMKDIGFSDFDVNEEIARLKNSSTTQLQTEYRAIHDQLSKRLYYFDNLKHQGSDTVRSLDFWMQQLHQWGTTAAMVAAAGAGAAGYNPEMLSAVASFGLFDPNLTFSNAISKRDILDMIYQQYAGFDDIKHIYVNVDHAEQSLQSKPQLLESINNSMVDLKIAQSYRQEQMKQYSNLSKQELEHLAIELKGYATDEYRVLIHSDMEKKVITLTKPQLLEGIKQGLGQLGLPDERIAAEMTKLNDLNVKLMRSAYLDTYQAVSDPAAHGKMPVLFSRAEQMLLNAPKAASSLAAPIVTTQLENEYLSRGKTPLYMHLKEDGMGEHIRNKPDGLMEQSLEHIIRAGQAFSIASSGRRFIPQEIVR